jgi:hypothetical protein
MISSGIGTMADPITARGWSNYGRDILALH